MSTTADTISTPVEGTTSRVYADALNRLYAGAAASFARPTSSAVTIHSRSDERQDTMRHQPMDRTSVATVADPEVVAELADVPELRAIEELRAWLNLTYHDVARAAGLSGASLLHHWRQRFRTGNPVRPRASSVEQLWRVHSLVRALAEALQGADQGYAVQLWFRRPEGGVTPLELLLGGRVDDVERRARALLFDQRPRPVAPSRVAELESDDDLQAVDQQPGVTYEDSDFG